MRGRDQPELAHVVLLQEVPLRRGNGRERVSSREKFVAIEYGQAVGRALITWMIRGVKVEHGISPQGTTSRWDRFAGKQDETSSVPARTAERGSS
jgi:hypothetical protein